MMPAIQLLWGNMDPVRVMCYGTPGEVEAAATQALATIHSHDRHRFVLSTGCTLPPDTPAENIAALIRSAGQAQ